MSEWLREAADELETAHLVLDSPRVNPAPGGAEFTLAARIAHTFGTPGKVDVSAAWAYADVVRGLKEGER
jgi:hypothetical protein